MRIDIPRSLTRVLVSLSMVFYLGAVSFDAQAQAQVPDPGLPGPLAVSQQDYDFGDSAFVPPGSTDPVELRGTVMYPSDLSGGPFPLIVFMHGAHAPCFKNKKTAFSWPCQGKFKPLPNFHGFDYVGRVLASNGFIVVSISENGVNATASPDFGMQSRAELIQKHLDIWNGFNTTGGEPFGSLFVGKVDMTRVGTVGHSAAGEGVVHHFKLNTSLGAPYGIKAVLSIAPIDDDRLTVNNVPFALLLSYCDGDAGMVGVEYYDDSRYNVPGDSGPKHMIVIGGANHNFYNTIWTPGFFKAGARDDGQFCDTDPSTQRLTDSQQRAAATAYISAFLRMYVKGETEFLPILTGAAPAPPSAQTKNVFVSYHPPDNPNLRLDVNRLLNPANLTSNNLGGNVIQIGLTPYDMCGGASPEPRNCLPPGVGQEPHTIDSTNTLKPTLSQLRLGWSAAGASYENDLPAESSDVSRFEALQFRVSVNFSDTRNKSKSPQDFTVQLTDGSGASSSVEVSSVSNSLFFPPGTMFPAPRIVLNAVRIPLSAFAGISLKDLRSISFKFDQEPSGAILVTDIAFVASSAAGDASRDGWRGQSKP